MPLTDTARQELKEQKAEMEQWLREHDDTHTNYSLIKEAYDFITKKLNSNVPENLQDE